MSANQGPKQGGERKPVGAAAETRDAVEAATAEGIAAGAAASGVAAQSEHAGQPAATAAAATTSAEASSADAAAESAVLTAANGSASASAKATLLPEASDAGEPPAREPADTDGGGRRRRRLVLIAVALAAVVAGAIGSRAYNIGFASRAADNSAIIRSGADPSTFLDPPLDRHSVVLPVANNSPDAVTVVDLIMFADRSIKWNGDEVTIPAGQTADVVMITPDSCPVTVLPQLQPAPAQVYLRVTTVNGKLHGISLDFTGVVAYALAECQIGNAAAGKAPWL